MILLSPVPLSLSACQLVHKNLHVEVQVSPVGVAVTGLAAHPMRDPMRLVAGQSGQRRGFSTQET